METNNNDIPETNVDPQFQQLFNEKLSNKIETNHVNTRQLLNENLNDKKQLIKYLY